MPNPKRRHSHARGALRRTHYKVELTAITTCPSCHQPRLPHTACPSCGVYDNRRVAVKAAERKEGA